MPIDSNRYQLLKEKLSLDPTLVAAFERWIVITSSGQIVPISSAGSCTLDDLLSPACTELARQVGNGYAPPADPTHKGAARNSFGKIPAGVWTFLASFAAGQGKSRWRPIYGGGLNQFNLKPLELGKFRPDGLPEYKSTVGLIGSGVDLGSLPLIGPRLITRRYGFGTHFDISPMIYYGLDAVPAWKAPVRGGGLEIKAADGVKVEIGVGKPQSGGMGVGIHLEIPFR